MIDVDRLAAEVDRELRKRGSAARRKKDLTYFPSALEGLGVKGADLEAVQKDLYGRLKKEDPALVVDVVRALVAQGTIHGRHVAYALLDRHEAARATLSAKDVEALGEGNDNWVCVDTFGGYVAGPCWRLGQVPDSAVRRWARSKDRWWRRTALVCTVALNQKARGGTGDPDRTLEICRMLVDDHDDMVVKALSWALRELSKRDREIVRAFMAEHDAVVASRVRREVTHKLETGRKN